MKAGDISDIIWMEICLKTLSIFLRPVFNRNPSGVFQLLISNYKKKKKKPVNIEFSAKLHFL